MELKDRMLRFLEKGVFLKICKMNQISFWSIKNNNKSLAQFLFKLALFYCFVILLGSLMYLLIYICMDEKKIRLSALQMVFQYRCSIPMQYTFSACDIHKTFKHTYFNLLWYAYVR